MRLVRGDEVGDLLLQRLAAGAQFVVRELLDRGIDGLDLLQIRLDLFAVLVGFRTEEDFDYTCKNIHNVVVVFGVTVLNPTKIRIIFRNPSGQRPQNGFSANYFAGKGSSAIS